jgi:carbon-monoxide dehydrogenase small subunit
MSTIDFELNGDAVRVDAPPDRLLLEVLREDLGLTGSKLGCGTGDCGACTVVLNGATVDACLIYIGECAGGSVETVERIAETPAGTCVTEELASHGAIQCGICTPGFVVSAAAALETLGPHPKRQEIQDALAGNLCRCTGYVTIIEAVRAAAERFNADGRNP